MGFLRSTEKYIRASAIGNTLPLVLLLACYTASLVAFTKFVIGPPATPNERNYPFISALSVVVGFLLVFRTNTAYERYSEGRKYWAQMVTNAKSLTRTIIANVVPQPNHFETDTEISAGQIKVECQAALRSILLFMHGAKNQLRDEKAQSKVDENYFKNDPRYSDMMFRKDGNAAKKAIIETSHAADEISIPLETDILGMQGETIPGNPLSALDDITDFLARHSQDPRYKTLNMPLANMLEMGVVHKMAESYQGCLRILRTPLPRAYSILLSHILFIFCVTFPLSFVDTFGWPSVFIAAVVHFVFLGICGIAVEIENPFGNDENDLPLERFVFDVECELKRLSTRSKLLQL